ncbi:beta-glucosidase, partial [Candidatus Bathyarchaeota archaeon]
PLYYNHRPTGRVDDYVDLRGRQPLFPFGHGLSYTRFDYSDLRIIPNKINAGETVNIYVDVKNIGEIEGDEVVQLYIHKQVSSVSRPVKELKAFKRITLKPGEVKTVNLKLGKEELAAYDSEMRFTVEPGIYEIMIGSSSEDIRLKGELQVI